MTQTFTALFDTRSDAQAATEKLVAAGISNGSIQMLEGSATTQKTGGAYDHARDEQGFWASLKDLFIPDEDRYSYAEGMSRGGTTLSVTVDDSHLDTAMDIVEEHGSVNLDERETSWRKEGWQGYTGAPATAASIGDTSRAGIAGSMGAGAAAGSRNAGDDKEYIPIVEEELRVGKRVTENGRVRVRSYVVETPVNEQVSLHTESVQIDRRPVDRAVTGGDALFAERTIDAVARSEEAVVSKTARVTEEIGIRKEASDRVETVTDKVRRTEVEIDDGRGNVTRTSDQTPRKAV